MNRLDLFIDQVVWTSRLLKTWKPALERTREANAKYLTQYKVVARRCRARHEYCPALLFYSRKLNLTTIHLLLSHEADTGKVRDVQ